MSSPIGISFRPGGDTSVVWEPTLVAAQATQTETHALTTAVKSRVVASIDQPVQGSRVRARVSVVDQFSTSIGIVTNQVQARPSVTNMVQVRLAYRSALAVLVVVLAASCGHLRWPDEPGVPVELLRWANVEAGEAFLSLLARQRSAAGRAAATVADRDQTEARVVAEELQAGRLSVSGAKATIARWARTTYGPEAETFAIDCSDRNAMSLPVDAVQRPFVAICYAAAHFRPRSIPTDQCVVLMTILAGSERVAETTL